MTTAPVSRYAWLPNAISFARMGLAPPIAWAILSEDHALALTLALVGGLSDALDGWLAKRYGWQTQLGGLLDPIADKLMLVAAFSALAVEGVMPWWLFILVLGRDLVIVAGAVVYHNVVGPLTARPTRISKLTTLAQIVFAVVLLVQELPEVEVPALLLSGLLWLVAATTVASGLNYVVTWSRKLRQELHARGTGTG